MSSRAERRAVERASFKAANNSSSAAATTTPEPMPYRTVEEQLNRIVRPAYERRQAEISAAQFAANRKNALLSTGPTTAAGKQIASHNAVKTGLTGRTVLLPSDDVEAYKAHAAAFESRFKPATDAERELVQSLADTRWRLNRIPNLEAGIFLRGRLLFADQYAAAAHNEQAAVATALVDAETLITYAKEIRSLHTQESRLQRAFSKDQAALESLQAERREAEGAASKAKNAATTKTPPPRTTAAPAPEPNGFVFSTDPNTSGIAVAPAS